MAVRGLKAKIAANVALLLLISALLTGILVVLLVQNILVRGYLQQHEALLKMLGNRIVSSPADEKNADEQVSDLLAAFNVPAAVWFDAAGTTAYSHGDAGPEAQDLQAVVHRAIRQDLPQRQRRGLQWAVVWWHAEASIIAVPLRDNGKIIGAGGAVVPLAPVSADLRRLTLPIVLYILFNTVVLTLIGLYRLFHIYLRPIERMVRQAEDYGDEEDFFFSFRREDNELNRLSKALNRMLGRIATDRQKLEESIASLAQANNDLRKARNDIIHAEKMASIGRLAAGVAHEIGNPIGIVLGYLDLLKQNGLNPEDREDFLKRSEMEIQRINKVIRQLLDLARPQSDQPGELSIHAMIEDFVKTIRAQPMLTDIRMDTVFHAQADRVFGDTDQLRQVLLNIVINAADAIRESAGQSGGAITIGTVDETAVHPSSANFLIVTIHDDGPGIAREQLPNIFDPFFTTKDPGKGTGLGLAVSYMIIEKMGGTITAQSTTGQGTTFTLRLPLMAGK